MSLKCWTRRFELAQGWFHFQAIRNGQQLDAAVDVSAAEGGVVGKDVKDGCERHGVALDGAELLRYVMIDGWFEGSLCYGAINFGMSILESTEPIIRQRMVRPHHHWHRSRRHHNGLGCARVPMIIPEPKSRRTTDQINEASVVPCWMKNRNCNLNLAEIRLATWALVMLPACAANFNGQGRCWCKSVLVLLWWEVSATTLIITDGQSKTQCNHQRSCLPTWRIRVLKFNTNVSLCLGFNLVSSSLALGFQLILNTTSCAELPRYDDGNYTPLMLHTTINLQSVASATWVSSDIPWQFGTVGGVDDDMSRHETLPTLSIINTTQGKHHHSQVLSLVSTDPYLGFACCNSSVMMTEWRSLELVMMTKNDGVYPVPCDDAERWPVLVSTRVIIDIPIVNTAWFQSASLGTCIGSHFDLQLSRINSKITSTDASTKRCMLWTFAVDDDVIETQGRISMARGYKSRCWQSFALINPNAPTLGTNPCSQLRRVRICSCDLCNWGIDDVPSHDDQRAVLGSARG